MNNKISQPIKLCVFQGTFNPFHNAHLRVAKYVSEAFNFDKILFIPAYNPPHKDCQESFAIHRYNMISAALEDYSKFELSDIEYRRKGKSYTYLTICELYKIYDIDGKINFIIGTDAFQHITSWYEFEKLKSLVKFVVFEREDNFEISDYDYLKKAGVDFEFQKLPFEDVSSTKLRQMIKNDEDISEFIPEKERDYIVKHGLYKD